MGFPGGGEKPAGVLRLIYTLGWLPALLVMEPARPDSPVRVLGGAGESGVRASVGLAASLAILTLAYAVAIRRPPSQRELIAACAGSLAVALLLPALFSADVYAYAYYGDLALHGHNPYDHDSSALSGALARAAQAVWDGHIPPRCVYGPLAVALSMCADVAGRSAGVAGQIAAQRLVAVAAYAACVAFSLRLLLAPRERAVLLLNPVVIWSVAEGHNDAAMLAFVLAAFAVRRRQPLLLALAAAVKAPAIAVLVAIRGWSAWAAAIIVAAYLPLSVTLSGARSTAAGRWDPGAWQSPLGLLAAGVGRDPAIVMAIFWLGVAALLVRRLPSKQRVAALALGVWFTLPNAYPWYALWFVPLAALDSSAWTKALLVASISASARAALDAIFPAGKSFDGSSAFHPEMIALEYLPPLLLVAALLGRRRFIWATALAAFLTTGAPCLAQSGPSPLPAPLPSTSGGSQPSPAPQPPPQPATPLPPPPTPPAPTASITPTPLATEIPPAAVPSTAVPPSAVPPAANPQTAAPVQPPVPATQPTVNPFGYVITPTAVPVTVPDGPHILEIDLNDRRIRAGGPLIVRVRTSANVVGVEARALGRFIAIPQNSPGLFSLAYTMPGAIPFWLLNKNYDIVIAAATADGRQTSIAFPLVLTPR